MARDRQGVGVKHFVHRIAHNRIAVAYLIPGTNVASIVCEGLVASTVALKGMAERLSVEPPAFVQSEDRLLVKGFYGAEQGDLF